MVALVSKRGEDDPENKEPKIVHVDRYGYHTTRKLSTNAALFMFSEIRSDRDSDFSNSSKN